MARDLVSRLDLSAFAGHKERRVIDPFAGDGRLLKAFAERIAQESALRSVSWHFEVWDNDQDGIEKAGQNIRQTLASLGLKSTVEVSCRDSFVEGLASRGNFNLVLTNPPWEALKPDRRELSGASGDERRKFESSLKAYDRRLAELLPHSQPETKLYGWGTNLSRCGLELALELLAPGGVCGIVLPASILADQVSVGLRRWMLAHHELLNVDHYPAEAKPFDQVDQPCITAVFRSQVRDTDSGVRFHVTRHDRDRQIVASEDVTLSTADLQKLAYRIPVELGGEELRLLLKLSDFPTMNSFTTAHGGDLWLGRELDETNYASFTCAEGMLPFIKGRNIERYGQTQDHTDYLAPHVTDIPASSKHARVAWRDVSRRSQVRRMVATLLPAKVVTGNSLHVGYFQDGSTDRLKTLLGVLNSLVFEFQLRSRLGTGHVSLSAVRGVHVADLEDWALVRLLAPHVDRALQGDSQAEWMIEHELASAMGLSREERLAILDGFPGLDAAAYDLLRDKVKPPKNGHASTAPANVPAAFPIPNHYTARLSQLDLQTAVAVPPGGNWKDIPVEVPSQRLHSIRVSYAAGGGSRSTYYGRLHPDRPSYTINTYFNRPGNGCHLHYDYEGGQHRVLSEREAARLQSFPDSFIFEGSHASIHKQVGNAVPPLLAFQIARQLGVTGQYVDLFSGAGGLSLGFRWAGWQPVVANDIEASFLATYRRNIHPVTVCGDIRHKEIFDEIVRHAETNRRQGEPFFVIGGPPCQGFSTAGKRRTLDDDRNHLFNEFKKLIHQLRPDGFIFENVSGLLNMDGGAVFEMIKSELALPGNTLTPWILQAEEYGIPQRRTRLVLVSVPKAWGVIQAPTPVTTLQKGRDLFQSASPAIGVAEALLDLPPLTPGEDGSAKGYLKAASTSYQRFMRGIFSPTEYLAGLKSNGGLSR
ncbi:MAG: DNA (cytosine-5-)-methyltransferase [Prosthecobacter sp.]|uniref:DNA (cytosine-5-)-methyltransferase n=1 Tax=Prosthecobacter sp. TaxID=1965333 RepID=UPI0038FEF875